MLTTALFAGGVLAAAALLWGADSPLSRLLGLDLNFLAWPVILCGMLLTFGRLALLLRGSEFAARVALQWAGRPVAAVPRLEDALPGIHRLLTDAGWTALSLGLLSSVSSLPGVISDHRWAPDITPLGQYLVGFDSLAVWGALIVAPFIGARALATVHPNIGVITGFPWRHLAIFGVAYALLGVNGALSVAFGLSGAWPLLGFSFALALSYIASALRRSIALRDRGGFLGLRGALYLTEAAWPLTLWAGAVALGNAARSASMETPQDALGTVHSSYLEVLYAFSALEALAVLLPFALFQYGRAFWPRVASIVPAPIQYLAASAVAYVAFADNGALTTAYDVDVSGMLTAVVGAIALLYTASALGHAATIDVRQRYARLALDVLRVLSALAAAAALAVVLRATLNHLPVASAILLEQPSTRGYWEDLLLFVGGFYDVRHSLAWLSFTAAAMFLMLRSWRSRISGRYQTLLSALSYFVVACLIGLVAFDLARFGHGFPVVGAVIAAGMLSLSLARLAAYAADSSNLTVAEVAGWLSASWLRAFALGAAPTFYALLLRPVVYDTVRLAALYEYIVLLALLLAVLMAVVNRLRAIADQPETAESGWADWRRHQQVLEHRADPRSALPDDMRRQFIEFGDWRALWVYLLALLYRSEASSGDMANVCQSLRRGGATPLVWAILGRSRRVSARTAALARTLDTVGRALADSTPRLERITEDDLRELAKPYIESGTEPEPLAVALIVAHCQRGDDLEQAVDRWVSLVDRPTTFLERFTGLWAGATGRPRSAAERGQLVDTAIASLFGDTPRRADASSPGSLEPNLLAGDP